VKRLDLLDAATAELLGFDWLVDAVAPISPYGSRLFSELVPFRPGDEAAAQARARRLAEVAERLHPDLVSAARSLLEQLPDIAGIVARASMGEMLDDPSFLELRLFCEMVERIDASLEASALGQRVGSEATHSVSEALAPGRSEAAGFYLSDAFDAELAAARVAYAQAEAEVGTARGREQDSIARELGREEIAGDEFIVMRSDLRGALPEGVRVVRESATYLLCALEYGESSRSALQRREAAFARVSALEERVRLQLSGVVREHAVGLGVAAGALGELDVSLGAVRFSQRHHCTAPVVIREPAVAFERARFLPLEAELTVAGRRYVPIDLDLRGAAVLTGPNMGGKSLALQTCGLLALCAAFGLPVPAANARVGLFDQIAWLGTGLTERSGGLLSSFAREVTALKEILARFAPRLLIFVDEFARTTTPHEGRALVVALTQRLQQRNACALLATHLQGVAAAAGVTHFAVRGLKGIRTPPAARDLKEALDALAASMDYTIAEVTDDDAPHADAIALAELLGLDSEFVEAAYRALSQ
jgi:DNA mismatch repair protein MutS2